jgi:hypothetical protein
VPVLFLVVVHDKRTSPATAGFSNRKGQIRDGREILLSSTSLDLINRNESGHLDERVEGNQSNRSLISQGSQLSQDHQPSSRYCPPGSSASSAPKTRAYRSQSYLFEAREKSPIAYKLRSQLGYRVFKRKEGGVLNSLKGFAANSELSLSRTY